MMGLHAAVLEDDTSFLNFVTQTLENEGIQVTRFSSGLALMEFLSDHQPELVFLDRLLPDCTGFELCEKIKLRYPDILIIMFSTLGETEDVIEGLDLGADEYLPKPFTPALLVAKVSALVRRCPHLTQEPANLVLNDLRIDRISHKALLEDKPLNLTKTEYQMLVYLMERPDELVTYEEIMKTILGYSACFDAMQQNIFFHMASLRKKLKHYRKHLETVRGFGYRLCSVAP